MVEREREREFIISNDYFTILYEAAKTVGVKLYYEIGKTTLRNIANYSKDRISADCLSEDNYVGVENLLKNKAGKVKTSYLPIEGNFIKFEKDDILIGNIRPYLRKIWISDIVGGTNGDVLTIQIKKDFKNKILPRFLYQLLSDENFFEFAIKFSKGSKMPRGDKNKIMDYEFFIPPLPVQNYIVSILDKFDTLVNDIKQGLPREIELRQKQYEYFRERLLDFPKES